MVTLLQEVLYLQIEKVLCNLFLDQMSVPGGCMVSVHYETNLRKSEEVKEMRDLSFFTSLTIKVLVDFMSIQGRLLHKIVVRLVAR